MVDLPVDHLGEETKICFNHLGEEIEIGCNIVRMGERRSLHCGELLGGITQRAPQHVVRPDRSTFEVDDADTDRRQVERCLEATSSDRGSPCPGWIVTIEVGAQGEMAGHPSSIQKEIDSALSART
jgi:hypothetical protein